MKLLTTSVVLCIGLISASGANAALVASADGQTVYDTDLNITWLSNANLAATNTFGLATDVNLGTDIYGYQSIINSYGGTMTWGGAQKWIAAMNAANYLGFNDWRLPTTLQPDASCVFQGPGGSGGYNCTGSEMGHLFYTELGGLAGQSIATTHNANYSLFQNVESNPNYSYWSGTESGPLAWTFSLETGYQGTDYKYNPYLYALAVRPGQVSAVPVPAAVWLFGSGLIGLFGSIRPKTTKQYT